MGDGINGIPRDVRQIPFEIDTSLEWLDFMVKVTNNAEFTHGAHQRLGQQLMNGLGDESPWMLQKITCDTRFDIWEVDDKNDPRIRAFFEKVFELFVEAL